VKRFSSDQAPAKVRGAFALFLIFDSVVLCGVLGAVPIVPLSDDFAIRDQGSFLDETPMAARQATSALSAHPIEPGPALAYSSSDLPAVERRLWNSARPGVRYPAVDLWRGAALPETMLIPPVPAAPERRRMVALTFDDGPNPKFTPRILKILEAADVRATFCVVGWMARRHPNLIRAIHNGGHVLCDHTEHHMHNLAQQSERVIGEEMDSVAELIVSITGHAPDFYRSPEGSISRSVIDAAHRRGMRVLGWSVDPHDFRTRSPEAILDRILDAVSPGAIILLHDGGIDRSATVEQLPVLIRELKELGYAFRTP
jgi:peptidoglycan/xylan/chitin deacetylase (PgdA/CDA1 family)